MAMALFITRAAEDAERTLARLPPEFEPWVAPVHRYAPAGTVDDLAAIAPFRPVLLVTSPRSVPVAVALAPGRTVVALAPRTAGELTNVGVSVRPVHGGLVAAMSQLVPSETLLLTSDLGAKAASERWPLLTTLATHRTEPVAALPANVLDRLALGPPFAVFFASPSAVHHFDRLAAGAILRAETCYFHGETTLHALQSYRRDAQPLPLGN